MTRTLSLLLSGMVLLASCGSGNEYVPDRHAETRTPLQWACNWLWDQQGGDGGWHSETYGLMRSGQSLTPFVLHALLSVPESEFERPEGGVDRALEFIRKHTNQEGCLGRSDPLVADYPNHATSYAIRCLVAVGHARDEPLINRMCAYLHAQQLGPGRGIKPESLRWGGWGFGSKGHPGVMDIGHTRHALEALRDAGRLNAMTCERAQSFLRMVQRHPDETRPSRWFPDSPQVRRATLSMAGFTSHPRTLA